MKVPICLSQLELERLAQEAAKDAHEKNIASRRGLYVVESVGIVYYDNNPFKLPREQDRREELILRFRGFLRRSKISEAASTTIRRLGSRKTIHLPR